MYVILNYIFIIFILVRNVREGEKSKVDVRKEETKE